MTDVLPSEILTLILDLLDIKSFAAMRLTSWTLYHLTNDRPLYLRQMRRNRQVASIVRGSGEDRTIDVTSVCPDGTLHGIQITSNRLGRSKYEVWVDGQLHGLSGYIEDDPELMATMTLHLKPYRNGKLHGISRTLQAYDRFHELGVFGLTISFTTWVDGVKEGLELDDLGYLANYVSGQRQGDGYRLPCGALSLVLSAEEIAVITQFDSTFRSSKSQLPLDMMEMVQSKDKWERVHWSNDELDGDWFYYQGDGTVGSGTYCKGCKEGPFTVTDNRGTLRLLTYHHDQPIGTEIIGYTLPDGGRIISTRSYNGNHLLEGMETFTYEDRVVGQCGWKNGLRHGLHTIDDPLGNHFEIEWSYGHKILGRCSYRGPINDVSNGRTATVDLLTIERRYSGRNFVEEGTVVFSPGSRSSYYATLQDDTYTCKLMGWDVDLNPKVCYTTVDSPFHFRGKVKQFWDPDIMEDNIVEPFRDLVSMVPLYYLLEMPD